jgi:hypothetical protein
MPTSGDTRTSIDKASEKLRQLLGEGAGFWCQLLNKIKTMPGAGSLFEHISESRNKGELYDHLAVVRYVGVFRAFGFGVEIEPVGSKGPDLAISRDGDKALVEVTRFREMYPGPPPLLEDEDPQLSQYGDLDRDTQRSWSKIMGKFHQVGSGQSIIAIWNDDDALEEIEPDLAVQVLRREARKGTIEIPTGLAFVVYGSKWIGPGTDTLEQQFYCFPLTKSLRPHHAQLIKELETSLELNLIRKVLRG